MTRTSAGIVLFREEDAKRLEVLIVHPGGPYWASKDDGSWSIPKGEFEAGEDPFAAAEREFVEEVGFELPRSEARSLGEIRQASGKRVVAWAVRGDIDPRLATSTSIEMEWPPNSGKLHSFPEVDRVAWFGTDEAKTKLVRSQTPFIDRLIDQLSKLTDD